MWNNGGTDERRVFDLYGTIGISGKEDAAFLEVMKHIEDNVKELRHAIIKENFVLR